MRGLVAYSSVRAAAYVVGCSLTRRTALVICAVCIPVGGKDGQDPHTADEIYVVLRGRARLVSATGEAEVGPGSVIFLPAGEEHSFADVTEDLSVLVVFGPNS